MKGKCPFCKRMIIIEGFDPDAHYVCPHCHRKLGRIKAILNSAGELVIVEPVPVEPVPVEAVPVKQMPSAQQDSGNDYLIDFVAVELKKDINYLTELGIKLDKGQLGAKTGGMAWAGYEAFTGDWLSALIIGGISLLSGGITNAYKRIKLNEMKQKWMDRFSELNEEQLAYLVVGLQRKYPVLLGRFQNLLQAAQGQ